MPRHDRVGSTHDYIRHTIDCLEEAEAALSLALRRGQLNAGTEAELARRIDDLTRAVQQADRLH